MSLAKDESKPQVKSKTRPRTLDLLLLVKRNTVRASTPTDLSFGLKSNVVRGGGGGEGVRVVRPLSLRILILLAES